MANITINEISSTYSYNIGTNSYATVALPITASWGPGFFNPASNAASTSISDEIEAAGEMMESTVWQHFPATQQGLEAFVAAYRGPQSNYRLMNDYSYQMAMTLMTAGYDVLTCRLCPGAKAEGNIKLANNNPIYFKAKYPGTFGNNIRVELRRLNYYDVTTASYKYYWNAITYVVDATGVKTSVENKTFVLEAINSTDSLYLWSEVESAFWDMSLNSALAYSDSDEIGSVAYVQLTGGSDQMADSSAVATLREELAELEEAASPDAAAIAAKKVAIREAILAEAAALAQRRYNYRDFVTGRSEPTSTPMYVSTLSTLVTSDERASILKHMEWIYTWLVGGRTTATAQGTPHEGVYDLLKDRLAYNPNRIISPAWDDQNVWYLTGNDSLTIPYLSPMHVKIMDVAYYSRCATGFIDVPKSLQRKYVWNNTAMETGESILPMSSEGYAQKLARYLPDLSTITELDLNGALYNTHVAMFAPWGQYTYVGTGRPQIASPGFLALMIQRAQILNQALQYEWALPTNRKHNLRIGKLDYTVPKKLLDQWQSIEGVSLNVITTIPDLGTNLWGNSTLFEVPPASYQALANLSTRYLVNAIENVVYRVGISITFQYNNGEAYDRFYAGCVPILDTMKNVGAIDDWVIKMDKDLNALDAVNANTVVGKIWLVVNGVINDIIVDLVALPPNTSLDQFRGQ